MANTVVGCWPLTAWRRAATNGEIPFPLGHDAAGVLVSTLDGRMMVQMVAAGRPKIGTSDPLQCGEVTQRAAAYSTCLAHFGTYKLEGDHVVHQVKASLFPDWSGQRQPRPFTLDRDTLTLHPPMHPAAGDVTNELIWRRAEDRGRRELLS
jgi:hypothetical protein